LAQYPEDTKKIEKQNDLDSPWAGTIETHILDIRVRSDFFFGCVRLGCKSLLAVDLDPNSVLTTVRPDALRSVGCELGRRQISVFDLDQQSWDLRRGLFLGVLHHRRDVQGYREGFHVVAPQGMIALPCTEDAFWPVEDREEIYSRSPKWVQRIESVYHVLVAARWPQGRFQERRETIFNSGYGYVLRHARLAWRYPMSQFAREAITTCTNCSSRFGLSFLRASASSARGATNIRSNHV